MDLQPRYVSLRDAACYVSASERWVRDEIRAGRLPAFKTNPSPHGGRVRVRLDDLDALMAANAIDPDEIKEEQQ